LKEKITLISPAGNSLTQSIKELIQNPGVLRALAMRDIRVRYAQTFLGIGWGLLQPLLGLAAVFVLFFRLAGIDSGGTPYLVFALSGLVLWNFFYYLVTQSSSGLVHMQAMIRKIYFPRLSIPFSKVLVGMVDLLIGTFLLMAFMRYYNLSLTGIWMIMPAAVITILAALGIGLIVSAISLRFRDLQQVIPFLLQILFFLTPVAYPSSLIEKLLPANILWISYLNPLTGVLELWRGGLFGNPVTTSSWTSVLSALLLFLLGLVLFGRTERKMADLI
jgi:lipopolysaccharide transport system permease protein